MADRKSPGRKELIIGYVVVATIIGAHIWGVTAAINHPKQTDTTTKPQPTQTASTQPEVASVNTKLTSLLTALKKRYPNVNDSYIFTASKDPNGGLNKPGQYNAGAAFCDNYDTLYTPQDTTDTGGSSNAYGFECGGTISVFPSDSEAADAIVALQKVTLDPNTNKCLSTQQGNSECSYKQTGKVVVHVSDVLTDDQQQQFLAYLSNEISSVEL